jgi:flagellar basal body rod protein FlgG
MRSILWLILVWLASTGPAAAAPEPSPAGALTFRANAEAAGEYIFLKDIAELSPEMTQAQKDEVRQKAEIILKEYRQGVSLDEELSNLIKFQRAYQAAARLISVADELYQTLLALRR